MAFAIRTENNYKMHALPDFESRIFAMWKSPIVVSESALPITMLVGRIQSEAISLNGIHKSEHIITIYCAEASR